MFGGTKTKYVILEMAHVWDTDSKHDDDGFSLIQRDMLFS
jgi:hypothetical protein